MRRDVIKVAVWAAVALSLSCKNGDRSRPTQPTSAVDQPQRVADVYFSTEVVGYIEPCGCTTEPLGGIQRLANVILSSKVEHALVDAGNFFLPKTPLTEADREQHRLKAKILSRAYRRLGAVAINVSGADLQEGAQFLQALQREGAVPLVSANLRPVGEGGPSIARSFLRTVGGIKIGVTGVALPEVASGKDGLTAIEFAPAVKAEALGLRKSGAEIVIVLAHVGESGARALAKAAPSVDIIVRAPGTPIEREPKAPIRVNDVWIVEAGSQGQHVGRLRLSWGKATPPRPLVVDDAGQRALQKRRFTKRKIKAFQMEADAWRVDPKKAEAVIAKEGQIAQLKKELARPAPQAAAPKGPHIRIDLIPLNLEVGAHPEMEKVLTAYYAQLAGMNAEKGDVSACAVAKKAARFIGSDKCQECHEEAYAFWKKTKHAEAWKTLEDDNKHFDLTCIGCHTVGYQKPGGFCRIKDVGVLKDVGCENCHGPGSIHAGDKDSDSIVLAAPEETCASACHVPEHSDGFVYAKYLREITGPGHELSEDD